MASSTSPSPYESYVNNKFCALFRQQQLSDTRPISSRLVTELSPHQRSKALEDLHCCVTNDDVQESSQLLSSSLIKLEIELECIQQKKQQQQQQQQQKHIIGSPSSSTTTTTTTKNKLQQQQHATKTKTKTNNNNCYYKKAMEISPDYVRGLHLKCLRAKSFDPKQAAGLLERFLELKVKLFGETTLCREITMADLTKEDIEYWKTGYMQIVNQRDLAGRRIIFLFGKSVQEVPVITSIRIYFLLSMKCIEEEVDQKKGIVCIVVGYGQTTFDTERAVHFMAARDSLPAKNAAVHQCADNFYLKRFFPVLESLMSAYDQCRHRVHLGSPLEVQYKLMSFGVQKDSFPIDLDGKLDMDRFQRNAADLMEELNGSYDCSPPTSSTARRQANIEGGGNLPDTYVPGPNDVIMGRHSQAVNAPGNVKLRKILEACREKYDVAPHRIDKMVLTHHVFEIVKERGGRFIKKRGGGGCEGGGKDINNGTNNSCWEEISDDAAREKVALGFRNLRRRSGGKAMKL